MAAYQTTIFQEAGKLIEDITSKISSADISRHISDITDIFAVWLTLYVMIKGFMALAGKSDDPVKDLIFKIAIYFLILTAASTTGTTLPLIRDVLNEFYTWGGFGDSLYVQLDQIFSKAIELGVMIEKQEKQTLDVVNMAGVLGNAIILIGFALFAIPAIWIIITSKFILTILVLIAPLMLLTLLFDWFKGIFQKWLDLIINNTLTIFFVGIAFSALINEYESFIAFGNSKAKAIGENGFSLSFEILFISLILMALILMAKGIAKELTYVSIESLPGSAAKSAGGGLNSTRKGAENTRDDIRGTRDRWKNKKK